MLTRSRDNTFARSLFAGLPARYDGLAEVLSFGQNGRWRTAMVDRLAAGLDGSSATARILDVATGTAGVALAVQRRTGARVVGIDLTEAMLREGRARVERSREAGKERASPVSLLLGRGEQLPFPDESFDGLTFTYLLRYVADPAGALVELARVVKPGGTVASLEFHAPTGSVTRPLWWLYTRVVLPAGGLVLGGLDWYRVGRFLGPSITEHYRTYPDSWACEAWQRAGLVDVGMALMSLGGGIVMWGRKPFSDG